jgi:hypothetical protein
LLDCDGLGSFVLKTQPKLRAVDIEYDAARIPVKEQVCRLALWRHKQLGIRDRPASQQNETRRSQRTRPGIADYALNPNCHGRRRRVIQGGVKRNGFARINENVLEHLGVSRHRRRVARGLANNGRRAVTFCDRPFRRHTRLSGRRLKLRPRFGSGRRYKARREYCADGSCSDSHNEIAEPAGRFCRWPDTGESKFPATRVHQRNESLSRDGDACVQGGTYAVCQSGTHADGVRPKTNCVVAPRHGLQAAVGQQVHREATEPVTAFIVSARHRAQTIVRMLARGRAQRSAPRVAVRQA